MPIHAFIQGQVQSIHPFIHVREDRILEIPLLLLGIVLSAPIHIIFDEGEYVMQVVCLGSIQQNSFSINTRFQFHWLIYLMILNYDKNAFLESSRKALLFNLIMSVNTFALYYLSH